MLVGSRGVRAQDPTQQGSATLSTLVAMSLFLVLFTVFAQLVVWQYGRGAVRSAALEGARAGLPLEAEAGACERRFESVVSGLLGGTMNDDVSPPRCLIGPDTVTVVAEVRFEPWLPITPGWDFTVTATATREVAPA